MLLAPCWLSSSSHFKQKLERKQSLDTGSLLIYSFKKKSLMLKQSQVPLPLLKRTCYTHQLSPIPSLALHVSYSPIMGVNVLCTGSWPSSRHEQKHFLRMHLTDHRSSYKQPEAASSYDTDFFYISILHFLIYSILTSEPLPLLMKQILRPKILF